MTSISVRRPASKSWSIDAFDGPAFSSSARIVLDPLVGVDLVAERPRDGDRLARRVA